MSAKTGSSELYRYAMQKKSAFSSGFPGRRVLIPLIVSVAASLTVTVTLLAFSQSQMPSRSSVRTVTFQERVTYQRAIEEVYWRHRIWPKENPDAKPSLDAVMSEAKLEKKVADYLRVSQTLEHYWQRPITAGQLQAEMDRMAKYTKRPAMLRELFEALGNDPFLIAECLARPVLAERTLATVNRLKEPFESQVTKAEMRVPTTTATARNHYTLPAIVTPSGGCTDDTWTPTSTTNAPAGRVAHTAVWTGSEMIVWGGGDNIPSDFNTGGRYDPSTDSWTATSTTNAPAGRVDHTAVWTGTEMIVWGGVGRSGPNYLNTGGRYNPGADSWTATSTTNGPDGRADHTAVWTGSEMIVWGGGNGGGFFNTGGKYDPSTDSWTATSTTNAPSARHLHIAVWTGSEMIAWGGAPGLLDTGGRYNPSTDSWTATSTTNTPDGRVFNTAVWTASEMIVWGGLNGSINVNTGGRYDPGTDSWTATSLTNAPSGRFDHTAVWTGSEMIVWGGADPSDLNTGGRYDPSTDSWTATSTTNAPDARGGHTAVWTGSQMIVWGGAAGINVLNTGGKYCAQSGPPPTPTPTPRVTPRPRPTPHLRPTPPR
jgi:N-acetylneuraminic acid mutarotase